MSKFYLHMRTPFAACAVEVSVLVRTVWEVGVRALLPELGSCSSDGDCSVVAGGGVRWAGCCTCAPLMAIPQRQAQQGLDD